MAVLSSTLETDQTVLSWPGSDSRRITVQYHVETDTIMGPLATIDGAGLVGPDPIPSYGDSYALFNEADDGLFLLDFNVRRAASTVNMLWKIDTSYRRRQPSDPKPGEFGTKPVSRTTEYWVEFMGRQIIMEFANLVTDLNGTPANIAANSRVDSFVNSVGDEYDEVPTDTRYNPVLVARHYFATAKRATSSKRFP